MTAAGRDIPVGRVGRPHGRDGSFYLESPERALEPGATVHVAGREDRVERWEGTAGRPLVRFSGVATREAAAALRGEIVRAVFAQPPLEEGEWLAEDLVGCRIEGLGEVRRVVSGPSCDVLEVGDAGVLVPFISDAVTRVDPEARAIEVDRAFLNLAPADGGNTT